ncbi:MAG: tetratricopeptide repeat protein, partial [Epsilonproteobacteria bacterium]|nr:tetratricopeptide repeat protein [Campylobacterota bacterium]
RGYKRAESYFYLGEIAYKRKKYKDAIKFFQNSAILNEEAIYMDKLLLHTAISLNKLGKKREAKSFFQAIIDSYPDTQSAKEAKRYIR